MVLAFYCRECGSHDVEIDIYKDIIDGEVYEDRQCNKCNSKNITTKEV